MFIREVGIYWDKVPKGSYLHDISAIRNIDRLNIDNPVTIFCGENGSGKSTLLEAIAIAEGFNPEGGTRNFEFSTYDSHSDLYKVTWISRTLKAKWGYFLRAESFYNVATKDQEYNGSYLHEMSHGECFLETFQENMLTPGLYFLDEPEAALSYQRQLTLLLEIYNSVKAGSQFFIVTHSPILLGYPGATILNFDGGCIHECKWEETPSYITLSTFINGRDRVLDRLLEDSDNIDGEGVMPWIKKPHEEREKVTLDDFMVLA